MRIFFHAARQIYSWRLKMRMSATNKTTHAATDHMRIYPIRRRAPIDAPDGIDAAERNQRFFYACAIELAGGPGFMPGQMG
jgi:hypothetical protein